jgi:YD repeat-containing protein
MAAAPAGALNTALQPGGLLSQTVQRTIDTTGNIVERTLDTAGTVVSSQTVGSLLSLPVVSETTNTAGQLVRQVRDTSGTLVELTLDSAGNLVGSRVLSQ